MWIWLETLECMCRAEVKIYGGECATAVLSLPRAVSDKHEYGDLALTLELVDSMDEAIDHIHAHGSGHTECIITGGQNKTLPPPHPHPSDCVTARKGVFQRGSVREAVPHLTWPHRDLGSTGLRSDSHCF